MESNQKKMEKYQLFLDIWLLYCALKVVIPLKLFIDLYFDALWLSVQNNKRLTLEVNISKSGMLQMELNKVMKDCINSKTGLTQHLQRRNCNIWVFPVVVDIVETMRYYSCRYGSFHRCRQNQLPPRTWPNRLAQSGYFFEDQGQFIQCFACHRMYPDHAVDCQREHENIPEVVFQREHENIPEVIFHPPPPVSVVREDPASIVNMRPQLRDEAENPLKQPPTAGVDTDRGVPAAGNMCLQSTSDSTVPTQCSSHEIYIDVNQNADGGGNLLPKLPTVHARTPAVGQNLSSDQALHRLLFTEDWRGPPTTIMINLGLTQLSNDSAKCHSCQMIIRNLSRDTITSELLRCHAPNCPFLSMPNQICPQHLP